ncbi:MAG: glycoside hydrolase family 2 [Bacteroidales bacterium]|nr:glycoside hydrolase family 2 [Bacteroidales bacterium]
MKRLFLVVAIFANILSASAQMTEIYYLSGTDKDHTVQWDFFCTAGRNSGKWSRIAVPSNWELQGFGRYNYGRDKELADEKGLYKYYFKVPSSFKNKRIFIVFEGSMTDTDVKINGISAGPVHQGSFYRFKYDITSLLKTGSKNLLEVTVSKMSLNENVNNPERRADYWIFGGIYRPVYLEAVPCEFIDHLAVDARDDGKISVDLYLNANSVFRMAEAQVLTPDGAPVGKSFSAYVPAGQTHAVLNNIITEPLLWSPEFPNMYKVQVTLIETSAPKHQVVQKFGFRTVEVRQNDGIYVNGIKIMFRGICRHSSWPTSGKTMSKELSIVDVNLMKDMNINAVRMSHYPPDQHFLDVCDSLGLFVLDELSGWQACYDAETGKKLIKEMVERDVNHPCIVLWDNGNEGGFNPEFRDEFAKYDPQKRKVIEPWSTLNGMNTKHYIPYNYGVNSFYNGRDIFFPTEFLHGLFDGGHGAGLDDYWNLMLSNPLSAGGFLWVFADEGVIRRDLNDSIDNKGNYAPDGILGPYREKEGSFYTIKEIWSPVFFEKKVITPIFDGRFKIENRFFYTNTNQCKFTGELVKYSDIFPQTGISGKPVTIKSPAINPGDKGWLELKLPDDWNNYDVINVVATDPSGRNINTWSWNITSPANIAAKFVRYGSEEVIAKEEGEMIIISSGTTRVKFDKQSGLLLEVKKGDTVIPFNNGPQFVGVTPSFKGVKHYVSGDNYVFEVLFGNRPECHVKWTMHKGGWLQLDYDYKPGSQSYMYGITFSFPEDQVKGATLLANGPYHVWKNRMKGVHFGIFEKKYNNTVTGESWDYPEFKGYYSNFYAVQLQTSGLPFTIVCGTEDMFLHLFTPQKPKYAAGGVTPPFPSGNISIMNGISAIGTKFSQPEDEGPQSQKNMYTANRNTEPLKGTLYFRFGE